MTQGSVHGLQFGTASVAQRVMARALRERPNLRVLEIEDPPGIRHSLENSRRVQIVWAQVVDSMAPPAGVEPAAYRLGGGRSIH